MFVKSMFVALALFASNFALAANVIWEDRGPIQDLNLFWGSSSQEGAPVGPFTFIEEDLMATNPKIKVVDANGKKWGVKWDEEVQGEIAATRLAWAVGLYVEESYYVPNGKILFPAGKPQLQRAGPFIGSNGAFTEHARFERKFENATKKGFWGYEDAPSFPNQGLAISTIMNVVLANWDAKAENSKVLTLANGDDLYLVGDYGACFGKLGGAMSHSKYKAKDYAKNAPVIKSVDSSRVYFNYSGKAKNHDSVSIEGARAFANIVSKLTLAQVEDAFRAANATEADMKAMAQTALSRMQEFVQKVK